MLRETILENVLETGVEVEPIPGESSVLAGASRAVKTYGTGRRGAPATGAGHILDCRSKSTGLQPQSLMLSPGKSRMVGGSKFHGFWFH